ncbi:hypothetical protein C8R43DRAFT_1116760 [Mycena crocata]|nr:hypothetical protein C8R43DRAFT_1116760 [Mycena crocata]
MSARHHPFQSILLSSLRDPMHRDSCCLVGIVYSLKRMAQSAQASNLTAHPFLRVAMAFICASGSDEEHRTRHQRLVTCHCDLQDPILSDLHLNANPGVSSVECVCLALLSLYSHIQPVLVILSAGKFRKQKPAVAPGRQPWPSSVGDIIPNDCTEGELLTRLLRWASEPGRGHAAFRFSTVLAGFWEPFAVQLLQTPTAFALAVQHLQHAVDIFPAVDVGKRPMWSLTVKLCTDLFIKMSRIDSHGVVKLTLPLVNQINAIGTRMRPILESMDGTEDARHWFINTHGLSLPRVTPRLITTGNVIIEGYAEEPLNQAQEVYFSAFLAIWEVRNRNQCMNLGCAQSNRMTIRSSVCARCGVLRYCSRECQKAAWKGPPVFPHKPLCGHICTLREGLGRTDAKSWDALILDSSMGRSAGKLLGTCGPYSENAHLSILVAIGIGLEVLSSQKLKRIQGISSGVPTD